MILLQGGIAARHAHKILWSHNQSKWSQTSQGTVTIHVSSSTVETVPPENITLLFLLSMTLWKVVFSQFHPFSCKKKYSCSLHSLIHLSIPHSILRRDHEFTRRILQLHLKSWRSSTLQCHNTKGIWTLSAKACKPHIWMHAVPTDNRWLCLPC